MASLKAKFLANLKFVFEPHRFEVAYGGRGWSKKLGSCQSIIDSRAASFLRILFARKFQNSIAESVQVEIW